MIRYLTCLLLFALTPAAMLEAQPAGNKKSVQGQLLGVHKSGQHREIQVDESALRTLDRYAFKSHDDYDFVVQVDKKIYVGRYSIPLAAKPSASRLISDWPAGTPVQVRVKKKGVFKKRMEMELVKPNGKKIPLLLVSVKDPIGRELCRKRNDGPDCTNINPSP